MPQLDPGFLVITDPLLLDVLQVSRRTESVNGSGQLVQTPVTFSPVYGIVTSPSSTLERKEDYDLQKKVIKINTLFLLRGESLDSQGQPWKSDIVSWRGNQYLVKELEDYSAYGQGSITATAELFDTVPEPPGTVITPTAPQINQLTLTLLSTTTFSTNPAPSSFGNQVYRNGSLIQPGQGYRIDGGNLILNAPLAPSETLMMFGG